MEGVDCEANNDFDNVCIGPVVLATCYVGFRRNNGNGCQANIPGGAVSLWLNNIFRDNIAQPLFCLF